MRLLAPVMLGSCLILNSYCASAQVSRDAFTQALAQGATYRKAAGMLPRSAHWIEASTTLWFDQTDGDRHEYVLVEATTGLRSTLDKTRIAAALNKQLEAHPAEVDKLWLPELTFDARQRASAFRRSLEHGTVRCLRMRVS